MFFFLPLYKYAPLCFGLPLKILKQHIEVAMCQDLEVIGVGILLQG